LINSHQLIYTLSEALNLIGVSDTNNKRVAFMALECAKSLNLSKKMTKDLFHVSLIHDCGVSSKKAHEQLISKLDSKGKEDHCIRGFKLVKSSQMMQHLSGIILYHHTNWEILKNLKISKETALLANLLFLTDSVDILYTQQLLQNNTRSNTDIFREIKKKIIELAGVYFDPFLVDVFLKTCDDEMFIFTLKDENLDVYFSNFTRTLETKNINLRTLKEMAKVFAYFVDKKSTYNNEFSINISKLSRLLAANMNLDDETCEKIEIAGLFHNLGKIRVPDETLNEINTSKKCAFDISKMHAYETFKILEKIKGIEDITKWATQYKDTSTNNKDSKEKNIPIPSQIIKASILFQIIVQNNLQEKEVIEIFRSNAKVENIDNVIIKLVENNLDSCLEISKNHHIKEDFDEKPEDILIYKSFYMDPHKKEFKEAIRKITLNLKRKNTQYQKENLQYSM